MSRGYCPVAIMPAMNTLVAYDLADGVATLTMDDSKVNALSPALLAALNEALDRAEADAACVVLAGRPGVFSAGFDLKTLGARDAASDALARSGFALVSRLLSFPAPLVGACTGHAVAMGALLLATCDYRIGASGDFKIMMNESAIGIPMPVPASVLLRERLHPSVHYRAVVLAETFTPDDAVATGWLDQVVAPEELLTAARDKARSLGELHRAAYHTTKLRVWQSTLDSLAEYLAGDPRLVPLTS